MALAFNERRECRNTCGGPSHGDPDKHSDVSPSERPADAGRGKEAGAMSKTGLIKVVEQPN
jgi:hypothetical protein